MAVRILADSATHLDPHPHFGHSVGVHRRFRIFARARHRSAH
jgi:hypothetical protein